MPESTPQVIAELVKPLFDFFLSRDERRAVEDSNELRFWQDGMLRQLKAIANGTATDETYKQLKANFEETDGPVREAMKRMAEARSRVRDGELAQEIDSVLHSDGYGKEMIRWQIKEILNGHKTHDVSQEAKSVCLQIDALNNALGRLKRMVYG